MRGGLKPARHAAPAPRGAAIAGLLLASFGLGASMLAPLLGGWSGPWDPGGMPAALSRILAALAALLAAILCLRAAPPPRPVARSADEVSAVETSAALVAALRTAFQELRGLLATERGELAAFREHCAGATHEAMIVGARLAGVALDAETRLVAGVARAEHGMRPAGAHAAPTSARDAGVADNAVLTFRAALADAADQMAALGDTAVALRRDVIALDAAGREIATAGAAAVARAGEAMARAETALGRLPAAAGQAGHSLTESATTLDAAASRLAAAGDHVESASRSAAARATADLAEATATLVQGGERLAQGAENLTHDAQSLADSAKNLDEAARRIETSGARAADRVAADVARAAAELAAAVAALSGLPAEIGEQAGRVAAALARDDGAAAGTGASSTSPWKAAAPFQAESFQAKSFKTGGHADGAPPALAATLHHLDGVTCQTEALLRETEAMAEAVLAGRAPGLPPLLAERAPSLLAGVETTIRRLRSVGTALTLACDGPAAASDNHRVA